MPPSLPTQTERFEKLNERIDVLLERLTRLSQQMELHNTRQEVFEAMVMKHENALYGDGNKKGYFQRFDLVEDKFERVMASGAKALWVIATVFLSGLALWIWEIFKAGVK